MGKLFKIRDPIHGFIEPNDWERDIIDHWVFQRLRRIKQLGLTDLVYPGATHTRFEHSLGVMYVAARMFDGIVKHRKQFLIDQLAFDEAGLKRDWTLIRLAALLHDVGHAPFSHATEGLMPIDPSTGAEYKHENYSAAAIRFLMMDVIDEHPWSQNHKITASEIADFLDGAASGRNVFWRQLISGHIDADRADYLLRDSYHAGVEYGKYDLNRLLVTMTVGLDETGSCVIAVDEGGLHAAEGLILARYMMFTQVYYQHTRRAFDHHTTGFLKSLLLEESNDKKDTFPPPTSEQNIREYLKWTDWTVLEKLAEGRGGEDGRILNERKHDRTVFHTKEIPDQADLDLLEMVVHELGDDVTFVDTTEQSWYKLEKPEIMILKNADRQDEKLVKLSNESIIVAKIPSISQQRVYVKADRKNFARDIVERIRTEEGDERNA
jgi:HD superfamily phosphohydrolase